MACAASVVVFFFFWVAGVFLVLSPMQCSICTSKLTQAPALSRRDSSLAERTIRLVRPKAWTAIRIHFFSTFLFRLTSSTHRDGLWGDFLGVINSISIIIKNNDKVTFMLLNLSFLSHSYGNPPHPHHISLQYFTRFI